MLDSMSSGGKSVKRGMPKGGGKGLKGSNLYTPVSQATIDSIKKMGMAAALKKAATSSNASYVQGVKRMYGAERLAKAKGMAKASKPAAASADAARGAYASKPMTKKVASSPDAARAAAASAQGKGPKAALAAGRTAPKPKVAPKKSGTTDPFARAVFGIGGAAKRVITGGTGSTSKPKQAALEAKRAREIAAAKKNKNK